MTKMMDHIIQRMPERNTMIRDICTGATKQESRESGYNTTMNETAQQTFHTGKTIVHSTRFRLRRFLSLRRHWTQKSHSHSRGAS
mmetsp:Transcript_43872/g.113308  ORF Transcript_43872/g.113308 Transcript_43872/m.113308 type:complete len:85 (+) Transcript_43872:1139-1393(+)